METVKLSRIVLELTPHMYPVLKQRELDTYIVLRDGFHALNPNDALEIVQSSISELQKDALLQ